MALVTKKMKSTNPMNNLFVKCTCMVVVCVLSVVASIAVMEHRSKVALTSAALSDRANEVTGLLAMQVGGAIKFGNADAISLAIGDVMEEAKPDAVGALVMSSNGSVLYSEGSDFDAEAAAVLASRAIESSSPAVSEDGNTAAYPAVYGDGISGAVVTVWSNASQLAMLNDLMMEALVMGTAVLAIAVALSGLFLRNQMSRPLTRIEESMREIADARFDTVVPYTGRGDEVGKMARRLDMFRQALAEARATERDNAFKSAAFEGSTAAIMIVDEELRVTYLNPSCKDFFGTYGDEIAGKWPGLDAKTVMSADLAKFTVLDDQIARIQKNGVDAFPMVDTYRLGDVLLQVSMNAALDRRGNYIGAVIEWRDKTADARNAALLASINENQLRLEFAATGTVADVNGNAQALLGLSQDGIGSKALPAFFRGDAKGEQSGSDLQAACLAGDPVFGRFVMIHASGSERIVEGSFASVVGPTGVCERIIFLGTDVTEAANAMKKAEEDRRRAAEEQEKVVEALGVGLQNLAAGNLSKMIDVAFPQDYEQLRSDFNRALEALQDAVGAVMQNAESIRNETAEITTAADDLSRRTEKQAATLEETAAALDQLTSSVKSAAAGADEASAMSADAQSNAEKGGEVARQAVKAMDGIKNSSQEISKITSVIDDIAFQTNLLALNAGVEAARAGSAGRGFAVVATEVRALAQRSSDAAREINSLISASSEQVQQGVDLVDKTGAALAAIVNSVSEISNRIASIAASSREQSTGLNEINSAVNELDHVTQQNAAMFEETTAASHALTQEAKALAQAVARFKLNPSRTKIPVVSGEEPEADVHKTGTDDGSAWKSAKPKTPRHATSGSAALDVDRLEEPEIDAGWEEF